MVAGDVAILATGHEEAVPKSSRHPDPRVDPWVLSATAIEKDATVLIVGTGLTMVDYVSSLLCGGHRGPVVAMSRRGLIPNAHRRVAPMRIEEADVPFGASATHLLRWFPRSYRPPCRAGRRLAQRGRCPQAIHPAALATAPARLAAPFSQARRRLVGRASSSHGPRSRGSHQERAHRWEPQPHGREDNGHRTECRRSARPLPSTGSKRDRTSASRQDRGLHGNRERSSCHRQSGGAKSVRSRFDPDRSATGRSRCRLELRAHQSGWLSVRAAICRRPPYTRRLLGDYRYSRHSQSVCGTGRPPGSILLFGGARTLAVRTGNG